MNRKSFSKIVAAIFLTTALGSGISYAAPKTDATSSATKSGQSQNNTVTMPTPKITPAPVVPKMSTTPGAITKKPPVQKVVPKSMYRIKEKEKKEKEHENKKFKPSKSKEHDQERERENDDD